MPRSPPRQLARGAQRQAVRERGAEAQRLGQVLVGQRARPLAVAQGRGGAGRARAPGHDAGLRGADLGQALAAGLEVR